jgi:predicted dehydrogenase
LIAGLGSIGRRHFNNLRTLGCTDFVFYRTFQSTIPDLDTGGWPVCASLDEALAHRPSIAVIANPTARHVEVASAAARAGCHLFIEKPLSHSLEHCHELAGLAQVRQLTTMIGCQFRFHPLLADLREQLRAGRIGEVLGARAEWGEYLPDWHPWEDHRASYSARADLGGGVVLTLIHPLDYLYWLFGPVSSVQSSIRSVPSLQTAAGDDWAEITLEFASGPIAHVHLDYVQKPPVHRLCVWGDRGRVTLDFCAGTLLWEAIDGNTQTERVPEGFERNQMFIDEMRHFLDAARAAGPSCIPLEEGIEVLDIALKARHPAPVESCRG